MSGLFGGSAGKKEAKEANRILKDNVQRLERIGVPTVEAQRIALTDPELVDQIVAEQISAESLGELSLDPRMRQAQMSVLDEFSRLGETGLGVEDQAALQQILRGASAQAQAQKDTALQEAAQRGTLDSGAALVAQLAAGQGAADRASQQGLQVAANAAAARRDALTQKANLASQIGQQDLNVQQGNLSTKQMLEQFNTQARNVANTQNYGYNVNRANQLAANRNQEELANKALIQQRFQNEIQKAGGVVGANQNVAANLQAQAQAAQGAQQAQTGAIIGAGTALATSGLSLAGRTAANQASPQNNTVTSPRYDANGNRIA